MIQLVVDGIFLDLYENDPPKLTLQFDSFETFQPQSAYSQTFRVPATDHNFQFFKTAFEINGYDFDVTQRREAQILVDGNEFVSGELRLNKIFNSNSGTDYEILFLGKTRDFASKLGSRKLNELDLDELTHLQTMSFVRKSWEAYPANKTFENVSITPSLNNGLQIGTTPPGTVLYPLVDFGNRYDGDELVQEVSISVGNNQHITQGDPAIVPIVDRIGANRFKPMVRARYLIDKVFEEAGFTYTSNFLTAELNPFQRLYVSAWGNQDTPFCPIESFNTRLVTSEPYTIDSAQSGQLFEYKVGFDTTVYDYSSGWDEVNRQYICPRPGTNDVRFVVRFYGTKNNTGLLNIRLERNGASIPQTSVTYSAIDSQVDYNFDDVITVTDTDVITVVFDFVNLVSTVNLSVGIFSAVVGGDISITSLLEDDYKQIDFIKDIMTMFKLVMIPDRDNPGNFIIEPWNTFIGSGDTLEWTDRLDVSKDVEIEPIFNGQKAEIKFTTVEEADWLNDLNQKTFKENFGDLKVNSNNDLLKDTKEIKLNYAATPVTEIQGASNTTGSPTTVLVGRNNMVIPHIYSLEIGDTRPLKKPIKPKTRFLFYNGMKYNGKVFNSSSPFAGNTTAPWYWKNDDDVSGDSSVLFPQVTPYQYTFNQDNYDPELSSINLTWQAENGYLRFGELSPGISLYDLYWKDYISLIYNKYSRRVTAYFTLSAEELFNFKFNDVVFVKDSYYYVEKIENLQIGSKESVKVSLIKLLNYNPPQGGFIPPFEGLVWEEVNTNWEALTDNWGAF